MRLWFWKHMTAIEILAAAIALFAANDTCLEWILDDVIAFTRTIKDNFSNANDDHLMSILDSAATFMNGHREQYCHNLK